MKFPSIYLASQSPRRRELLQQMSVDFVVIQADVDESVLNSETAMDYARRVAMEKAETGWTSLAASQAKRPVLAADTAVVLGEQIFGKPNNEQQAREMLQSLSGQTHQVITAVALADAEGIDWAVSVSDVRFAKLSENDITWYISTGEGVDKAGGYAVQGLAALFIEQICGSYSGIMGLPIRETGYLLMRMEQR